MPAVTQLTFALDVMGPGLPWFGLLNISDVIVCHCFGVSDRRIQAEAGLGAADVDDITSRCGAGGDCGGCVDLIEDILEIRVHGDHTAQLAS